MVVILTLLYCNYHPPIIVAFIFCRNITYRNKIQIGTPYRTRHRITERESFALTSMDTNQWLTFPPIRVVSLRISSLCCITLKKALRFLRKQEVKKWRVILASERPLRRRRRRPSSLGWWCVQERECCVCEMMDHVLSLLAFSGSFKVKRKKYSQQ